MYKSEKAQSHGYQQTDYSGRQDLSPPPILKNILEKANVSFNGHRPWDIQVHDKEIYRRILTQGSLGLGESYMDGLWDCPQLDHLFYQLMVNDIDEKVIGWARVRLLFEIARAKFLNLQNKNRAFQVGEQHYDIGNDVFEKMLDTTMSYSCAYWAEADNLEDAQRHKLDMICQKLELKPGQKLLDIGCGWGGLAAHAAKHYGVEVTGVTVSKEQQALARKRCEQLPVTIHLMDYRSLTGQFDKIVSVGMFEHVGPKNYQTYFETTNRLLKDNGLFLLHSIGSYVTKHQTDAWIDKYIFPNGKLPSALQLTRELESRFIIEDWHNFGMDYDKTLMAWWQNFDASWNQLSNKYSKRFYRMWRYYLHCCAGFFRSRQGQLWQLVLTKRERNQVYRSIRSIQ